MTSSNFSNFFLVTVTNSLKPRQVIYGYWDKINTCIECKLKKHPGCSINKYCIHTKNSKFFQLFFQSHHECKIIQKTKLKYNFFYT